jgi:hypothetical protein
MQKAVGLRPDYIFHRLDLAEMLVELKRGEEARSHLEKIQGLSNLDAMDPSYRARASVLLSRLH